MTEVHAGLALFRDQLHDAITRDVRGHARAARRRRLAAATAVPVAGVAAAGLAVLTLTGPTTVQNADAAILHRVAAALRTPPAMILHERAMVTDGMTTQPYELWEENVPPFHYHVMKWGHSGVGTAGVMNDPAAELRSLVRWGKATVAGTATIRGVAAIRLRISGSSDRFLNGTAYVDRGTYRPLEIDTTGNGGEKIVFETYQYLPATAANLARMHAAGGA